MAEAFAHHSEASGLWQSATGAGHRPSVKVLHGPKVSAEEWQALCPDSFVWVIDRDRNYPVAGQGTYLGVPSYRVLCSFGCVARESPPLSRLNQVRAALGLEEPRYAWRSAVEVFYVTPAAPPRTP